MPRGLTGHGPCDEVPVRADRLCAKWEQDRRVLANHDPLGRYTCIWSRRCTRRPTTRLFRGIGMRDRRVDPATRRTSERRGQPPVGRTTPRYRLPAGLGARRKSASFAIVAAELRGSGVDVPGVYLLLDRTIGGRRGSRRAVDRDAVGGMATPARDRRRWSRGRRPGEADQRVGRLRGNMPSVEISGGHGWKPRPDRSSGWVRSLGVSEVGEDNRGVGDSRTRVKRASEVH